jgi:hypothetical protein
MNDDTSYTYSVGSSNHYVNHINHNIYDKGYHHIRRKKIHRGKFTLEYYDTCISPETRIRNAVTGNRYRDDHPKLRYLVGSRQEDLFFKVIIANGENGNNPVFLFYDNPEQFEKHQRLVVSQQVKEKWLNKHMNGRLLNMKFLNEEE